MQKQPLDCSLSDRFSGNEAIPGHSCCVGCKARPGGRHRHRSKRGYRQTTWGHSGGKNANSDEARGSGSVSLLTSSPLHFRARRFFSLSAKQTEPEAFRCVVLREPASAGSGDFQRWHGLQVQVIQLRVADFRRCLHHQILSLPVEREGDDLADAGLIGQ